MIKTEEVQMATLVSKIRENKKIKNKNRLKVALSKKDNIHRALYF